MNFRRREFLQGAAAAGVFVVCGKARAQTYPGRPVHILVGLAAGGPTAVAARLIADRYPVARLATLALNWAGDRWPRASSRGPAIQSFSDRRSFGSVEGPRRRRAGDEDVVGTAPLVVDRDPVAGLARRTVAVGIVGHGVAQRGR